MPLVMPDEPETFALELSVMLAAVGFVPCVPVLEPTSVTGLFTSKAS